MQAVLRPASASPKAAMNEEGKGEERKHRNEHEALGEKE
jgi:hypothetical protein